MSSTAPSEAAVLEHRRNRRVALICVSAFVLMLGAAFAAVPIYRAFCQLTGFDGSVRRAEAAPGQVLAQRLDVRFDANVRGGLPWTFTAEQASQTVRIGETGLAFFKVTNNAATPITGRAVYNVVPEQAGPYFQKLECFCFSEQTIGAGETMEFPVVYFVDPKYAEDFETKGKREVTLSYTFYPAVDDAGSTKPIIVSALGEKARPGL